MADKNQAENTKPGCLDGIRVIDMTSVMMGPVATQALGDMGADVIKVESPIGDTTRMVGKGRSPGMGPGFLQLNRNKRSICLNLKSEEGMSALLTLLETADVLVYNVRPQSMKKLGLDWDSLQERFPKLIHVGAFGFGQDGPYAARPAYDDLIQAASGLPMLLQDSGAEAPMYAPVLIADRTVGIVTVNAVLGALFHRERSGEGQAVEVPMFETMIPFVLGDHIGGRTYDPPNGPMRYPRLVSKSRRPFPTADGYISTVIYTDAHWKAFCQLIGEPELFETDPRMKTLLTRTQNIDDLYAMIGGYFAKRTTDEWMELLETADIPSMRVHSVESVFEDPHLVETGYFEIHEHPTEGRIVQLPSAGKWTGSPPSIRRLAPRLGEHTIEVLSQAGIGKDKIQTLLDSGDGKQAKPV